MSTCISQRGEFSSHEPDADHVCTFCGVLNEDALIEELRQARESVSSLTAENERLRTDLANLEAGKGELYDDLLEADTALQAYRARAEAAEVEVDRLRKERDDLSQALDARRAINKADGEAWTVRVRRLEADVSSLRELESAARKWRAIAENPDADVEAWQAMETYDRLIAVIDALPPTPPATEGSDDTA